MELEMITLFRLERGMDAHSGAITTIEAMTFPEIRNLRVLRSEFRSRERSEFLETFALTMIVAVSGTIEPAPRAIAFIADGWRRGDLVALALAEETTGPSFGALSRDLAALLDPPMTEEARRWRARATIAFSLTEIAG
ncbi:MAG: hypothetical protein DI556_13065 [Rhodovulum sulfidophilum]|uniref:Uncharacterized protein n=1 Tax=Rhodovulum sulfidophilum TaxID=35806 RepID=A0A2W5N5J6_RHOSU|nr:MAG: hypothetical protein DI556_13065 [Rhodovulum sulfidophilum]